MAWRGADRERASTVPSLTLGVVVFALDALAWAVAASQRQGKKKNLQLFLVPFSSLRNFDSLIEGFSVTGRSCGSFVIFAKCRGCAKMEIFDSDGIVVDENHAFRSTQRCLNSALVQHDVQQYVTLNYGAILASMCKNQRGKSPEFDRENQTWLFRRSKLEKNAGSVPAVRSILRI